jgi:hypothetical protein
MNAINISVYASDSPETINISVSDDASSWTNVLTAVQETSEGGWDEITFTETSGRYLRLNITTAQRVYSTITELQIKTRTAGKTNVPYSLSTMNGGEFLIRSGGTDYTANGSSSINDGNWHHLAATYNGSIMKIYIDGTLRGTNTSFSGNLPTNNDLVFIGKHYDLSNSSDYFNGTIDEVMIFNRSLSAEQISALFNNKTNLIVSNETEVNDVWKICVTPNDGTEDGDISCSNNVTILSQSSNSLPTVPILISLINGSTTTDRTPTLAWNNSVDNNGDIISYNLIIDDNSAFNNPEINVTSVVNVSDVNTTYDLSIILDVDTTYFWKVAANDSYGYGGFSEVSNFTVQSYLSFSLLTSSVSFGNVNNSGVLNTTDNDPLPFRGENTGNIKQNITLNASRMFTAINYPSSSYMFKIRTNESGAFNSSLSRITWQNFSKTSSDVHVVNLNWLSFKDDFLVDLNLSIPSNETAGEKTSTVTFSIE